MFETVQGEYLPLFTLDRTRCCRSALWRPHGMILPRYGPHTRLIKYIFPDYYMARQIRAFWLVLSRTGFSHTDRFRGNGHKLCIFCFRMPANSKQVRPECHIINYLLSKLARAVLKNIGPCRFCTDLALPRSRANIPQRAALALG